MKAFTQNRNGSKTDFSSFVLSLLFGILLCCMLSLPLVQSAGLDKSGRSLDLIWNKEPQHDSYDSTVSALSIINKTIAYFAYSPYLYAFHAYNASNIWNLKLNPGGDVISYNLAVYDDTVYVCGNSRLYAVHANTGVLRWSVDEVTHVLKTAPIAFKGAVYVIRSYGTFELVSYNASTGVGIQRSPHDLGLGNLFLTRGGTNSSTLIVTSKNVISAFSSENLTTLLWKKQLASFMYSAPVIDDEAMVLYVGSSNGVSAYNISGGGATVWRADLDASVQATPTIATITKNGVTKTAIFVNTNGKHIYAIDATNGQSLWFYPMWDDLKASPIVVDGIVYVATSTSLRALTATNGTQLAGNYSISEAPLWLLHVEDTLYVNMAKKINAFSWSCLTSIDCNSSSHVVNVSATILLGCQCTCLQNYSGTTCEECATGFSGYPVCEEELTTPSVNVTSTATEVPSNSTAANFSSASSALVNTTTGASEPIPEIRKIMWTASDALEISEILIWSSCEAETNETSGGRLLNLKDNGVSFEYHAAGSNLTVNAFMLSEWPRDGVMTCTPMWNNSVRVERGVYWNSSSSSNTTAQEGNSNTTTSNVTMNETISSSSKPEDFVQWNISFDAASVSICKIVLVQGPTTPNNSWMGLSLLDGNDKQLASLTTLPNQTILSIKVERQNVTEFFNNTETIMMTTGNASSTTTSYFLSYDSKWQSNLSAVSSVSSCTLCSVEDSCSGHAASVSNTTNLQGCACNCTAKYEGEMCEKLKEDEDSDDSGLIGRGNRTTVTVTNILEGGYNYSPALETPLIVIQIIFNVEPSFVIERKGALLTEFANILQLPLANITLESVFLGSAIVRMGIRSGTRSRSSVVNTVNDNAKKSDSPLKVVFRAQDGSVQAVMDCSKVCSVTGTSYASANAANTGCECHCKNSFSGPSCETCATQFSGVNCDACAEGHGGYPNCAPCDTPSVSRAASAIQLSLLCQTDMPLSLQMEVHQTCEASYCDCLGGVYDKRGLAPGYCNLLFKTTPCQEFLCLGLRRECLSLAAVGAFSQYSASCQKESTLLSRWIQLQRQWCMYDACHNESIEKACSTGLKTASCEAGTVPMLFSGASNRCPFLETVCLLLSVFLAFIFV